MDTGHAPGAPGPRIDVVRLTDLRNYRLAEFRPAKATTVVVGANGSGKSNLLEAIGLFATLTSSRTGHLGVLVRQGEQEAGMRLETDTGSALEIRLRGGRALLRAGGTPTVARSFLGRFRAVLFTPEDLDLVRGEPGPRRRTMDDIVVQLRPAFRGARQTYDRALRQRNRALRLRRAGDARSYDGPLAESGATIIDARRRLVGELEPIASDLYARLAGGGSLALTYRDTAKDDGLRGEDLVEHLLARYADGIDLDLDAGTTRVGPHRDDLDIAVDGNAARLYSSRGEQRSAALSIRIAQLRLLQGAVLLLDDVLSELDVGRRTRLFDSVAGVQVVVASADRAAVPDDVRVDAEWRVENGTVHESRR